MKNISCILLMSGTLFSGYAHAARNLASYGVEPEVKAILDEHSHEVYQKISKIHDTIQWHGVWQFDWLPGYYVKYGLERIKGVERIRQCIETYGLDKLTTPDKRVYHIKGRPYDLSNLNYAIVVKAVEATENSMPLALTEVQQLCTIIHKADYIDMTSTNYIKMPDGKICLIDTEGIFNADKRIKGFLRMIGTRHNLNTDYTQEALQHIFFEIKEELKRRPDQRAFALAYLKNVLRSQELPHAWNYTSYADEYFKEFEKEAS